MWNRLVDAYKWRRTLASCRLDLRTLPTPLTEPGPRDFILAGSPRTGTSLLTAALYHPPGMITVMEPWDGLRVPPAELFQSVRSEISDTGRLSRGRLNLDALADGDVEWQRDGERSYSVEASPDFTLGVKWPTFWQYLEVLPNTKFVITLRHPVEVIASYERVGGRLALGLEYDVPFNAPMNDELTAATDDLRVRRALLYQYINSRILPHLEADNVFVVRYERWFEDPEQMRQEISEFLETPIPRLNVRIRPEAKGDQRDDIVEQVQAHVPVSRELGYDV